MVEGETPEDALAEATRLGINPGGEALCIPVFQDIIPKMKPYLNRLISPEEMLAKGGKKMRDIEKGDAEVFEFYGTKICGDCNKP